MKIAVIFGGTYEMYLQHAKILDTFNKYFEMKDERTYTYFNHELKVFFCLGPKLCKSLEYAHMHVTKAGERCPPPADVVAIKVKKYNPDKVLFFGIAGGINVKLNQIYYPIEFYEFYFKSSYLIHKQNIIPKNRVIIKNLLGNDKIRVLTTNFVFNKYSIGAGEDRRLWGEIWGDIENELKRRKLNYKGKKAAEKWCEIIFYEKFLPKLKKFGDIVDMESYVFAKKFKNIGIMLQVSDVIGEIELTFERKTIDWKKFNKNVVSNLIKILNAPS